MNEQGQVDQLRKTLTGYSDVKNINIDLPSKRLVIETSVQSSKIQQLIEQSLQTDAVLLGIGKPSISNE